MPATAGLPGAVSTLVLRVLTIGERPGLGKPDLVTGRDLLAGQAVRPDQRPDQELSGGGRHSVDPTTQGRVDGRGGRPFTAGMGGHRGVGGGLSVGPAMTWRWLVGGAGDDLAVATVPGVTTPLPSRSIGLSPPLAAYVAAHLNPPPDPVAARLAATTRERFGRRAGMNVGEDQGRLLQWLVELSGAREVVEVGTFTGMSALWLARGLGAGGRLTCFEVDPAPLELARPAWEEAGVAERISVVIGPAADGLAALPAETTIDLAFVDADKGGYAAYVELILPRLRTGGLLALDNTLWGGAVVDPAASDADTVAIRALNDALTTRPDLDVLMLAIGDGLTLVRRRRS